MDIYIENVYKVYIKTDENGFVTAINSSAFLDDLDGWTEIDSGVGDRFCHAQNNYFSQPVIDAYGIYRYKFLDGQILEKTQGEIKVEKEKIILKQQTEERIADLKNKLASTDYTVIKIAESVATAEDYAEIISARQAWRAEINELEASL